MLLVVTVSAARQVGYGGARGYATLAAFVADLERVVANCCAYNAPGSAVFRQALALAAQAQHALNAAAGSAAPQKAAKRPRR